MSTFPQLSPTFAAPQQTAAGIEQNTEIDARIKGYELRRQLNTQILRVCERGRLLRQNFVSFFFFLFLIVYCVSKANYTNQIRGHEQKFKKKPFRVKKKIKGSLRVTLLVDNRGEGVRVHAHLSPSTINTWCGNGIPSRRGHILCSCYFITLLTKFED